MTDTPASSADGATSSPASPETAKIETSNPGADAEVEFTFSRGKMHKMVLGDTPFVLLRLNPKGVEILGGGLDQDAPNGVVVEFLIAAGDAFHQMANDLLDKGLA